MSTLLNVTRHGTLLVESYIKDQKRDKRYREYIINDSYQRNYVWLDNKIKKDLIHSILLNRPIGTIIMWKRLNGETVQNNYEVVDGQQRLTTINNFYNGQFKLDYKYLLDILNIDIFKNRLKREAERYNSEEDSEIKKQLKKSKNLLNLTKGDSFFFRELPDFLQEQFLEYQLNITGIENIDEKDVRKYFEVLQNQESLKAGEILNSFSFNPIKELISDYEFEQFSKITNFNDNRKGLLKNVSAAIGTVLEITNVGEAEKTMVKKMQKVKLEKIKQNDHCNNIINCLKEDIQKNVESSRNRKKFKVIDLKILLLTYAFNNPEIYKFCLLNLGGKTDLIKRATEISGVWNSKDRNKIAKIEENLKSRFKVPDYVMNGLRNMWLLSRSTHNLASFMEKKDDIFGTLEFLSQNKSLKIDALLK